MMRLLLEGSQGPLKELYNLRFFVASTPVQQRGSEREWEREKERQREKERDQYEVLAYSPSNCVF